MILFLCLFFLASGLTKNSAYPVRSEQDPPQQVDFKLYFSCYNCGIDWAALLDPNNNPILNTCIAGADLRELQKLDVPGLDARLRALQDGNLLKKTARGYTLAFPAVLGGKRQKLQQVIEKAARDLLPIYEQAISQMLPVLNNRQEMLYHVLWSVIMDGGVAWHVLQTELGDRLQTPDTSLSNTTWLAYPNHPFRAGTNSYDDLESGYLVITWSLTTPCPTAIHRLLKGCEVQLVSSAHSNTPVDNCDARESLARYGFLDKEDVARVFILDANSCAGRLCVDLSLKLALETIKRLDVSEIADMLATSQKQALVITYHELCYEIIDQLSEKGALDIPEMVVNRECGTDELYRLVSLIRGVDPSLYTNLKW